MWQKDAEWKFFAPQILQGPTDVWDKINGDQTLLNLPFSSELRADSSEEESV